jgi:hypothetical protein
MRNSKMFKMGSFEEELAKGMETKLVSRQNENQFSFDRIAKAVDFINAASQIFDDTGFYTEAEVLTKMLERIANNQLRPKTAMQWENLSKEEQEFYHSLPGHIKRKLKSGEGSTLRTDDPALDYADFIDNIKSLYQQHKMNKPKEQEVPEFLEFQSLGPRTPEVSIPDDDIIEFESAMPELEKEHELAPLRLMEQNKKKVSRQ